MGVTQPDRSGSRSKRGRTRAAEGRAALLASACILTAIALPAPARAVNAAEAATAAATVSQAATVPAGWTGSTAGACTTGTESQASLDATLQGVNAFRSVAGLGPVTFDATLSQQALSAAVMMKGEGTLSHDPPEYVTDANGQHRWQCWSAEGRTAAGRSNLALGSSGAAAIRLYVADEGVAGLGHRRWILDPAANMFGSGSTGSSNALTVFGGAASAFVASGTQVAWPPAGSIAPAWLPSTWSVSVGGTGDNVVLTTPTVTMTLDGAPVGVSQVSDLGTGYGTGRAIGWVPSIDRTALRNGYHELAVSVAGFTVNGIAQPVSYTATVGTAPAATPTPSPTTASSAAAATPGATITDLPQLRPRIARGRGRLRPGMHVTASFRQGTGRIVTRIQWLRSGRPIKRANSVRLRVTTGDRGRTLRVKVWSQSRTGTAQLVEQSTALRVPKR